MSDSEDESLSPSQIAFSFVPFNVVHHIAMLLDPPIVAQRCKDWKGLADKLGYITHEIYSMESRQTTEGSNTKKLLADYVQHHGNNVGQVMTALQEMERVDAYDVMKAALPEIRKKKKEWELSPRQPVDPQQNSCDFESMGFGPPHRVMFNSGHVYELQPSSPTQISGVSMRSFMPSEHHGALRSTSDPGVMPNNYDQLRVQRSMSGGSVSITSNSRQYHAMRLNNIRLKGGTPSCAPVEELMETEQSDSGNTSFQCGQKRPSDEMTSENGGHSDFCHSHAPHHNCSKQFLNSVDSAPTLPSYDPLMHNGDQCHSPVEATWNSANNASVNNRPRVNVDFSDIPETVNSGMRSPCSPLLSPGSLSLDEEKYKVPSPSARSDITSGARVHKYNALHPCETFPKGAKEKPRSEIPKVLWGVQEERALLSQYKSISEPRNISPAPFGLAKRETRVFLTYASDSTAHLNRVMAAADNLRKNGFRVSCDMYEKEFVNHSDEARDRWLKTKYSDVDFILICISPLYWQQVQRADISSDSSRSMHEAAIFRMMEREACEHGSFSRFICLLFKDACSDHIPPLLRKNAPVYAWPSQYKDLFFKLIKPEKILTNSRAHLGSMSSLGSSDGQSGLPSSSSGVRNPVIIRREVT